MLYGSLLAICRGILMVGGPLCASVFRRMMLWLISHGTDYKLAGSGDPVAIGLVSLVWLSITNASGNQYAVSGAGLFCCTIFLAAIGRQDGVHLSLAMSEEWR
ncbi:hypothetical protein BG74_09170 [Sodalis-like endosymbiont of Proechinophthirus fluctus]|nr:hypothetical protein BG74_09170 [Sodalis-like endosymbiont of Proechinophthirus fluctus]